MELMTLTQKKMLRYVTIRLKWKTGLLRMRETYEKRMKINEIIFIRTKLQNPLEMPVLPLEYCTVHLAYL